MQEESSCSPSCARGKCCDACHLIADSSAPAGFGDMDPALLGLVHNCLSAASS